MEYKVFTQCTPPIAESEKLDTQDIKCLDKTSLTTVVEFMHKYATDKDFTPPTKDVIFDSEKYNLNIDEDSEFPSMFMDIEDLKNEDVKVEE